MSKPRWFCVQNRLFHAFSISCLSLPVYPTRWFVPTSSMTVRNYVYYEKNKDLPSQQPIVFVSINLTHLKCVAIKVMSSIYVIKQMGSFQPTPYLALTLVYTFSLCWTVLKSLFSSNCHHLVNVFVETFTIQILRKQCVNKLFQLGGFSEFQRIW